MKWSLYSRPDARLTGVVCTLLSLELCVIAFVCSPSRSLAEVTPLYLTSSSVPGSALTLVWDPSPDSTVAGYFLCWGTATGHCTNLLDAGTGTTATVGGFTNVMYYFNVVAYNSTGQQAAPSNEVQYSPTNISVLLGPTLGIQPTQTGDIINLSFRGTAYATYAVLASQDFIKWDILCTTNCTANAAVVFRVVDVTNYIRRFYRVVQMNYYSRLAPLPRVEERE
jgi:hypothetical protein